MREVLNSLCSARHLDHGMLCGTSQDLNIALRITREEGPPMGLCLNHCKSFPFISPWDDICKNTLPFDITSSGFCLLHSPIGSDCFREASILDRVAKIQRALGRLGDLQDSQVQTTHLRFCLSLLKLNFTVQTCPPSVIQKATSLFHDTVQGALEDIQCQIGHGSRPTFPAHWGAKSSFCMPELLISAQSHILLMYIVKFWVT